MPQRTITLSEYEARAIVEVLRACTDKLDERVRLTQAGRMLGITDSRWGQSWDAITARHLLSTRIESGKLGNELLEQLTRLMVRLGFPPYIHDTANDEEE